MSRDFDWPTSTNKGTALLKLLHQRMTSPLFRDEFVQWFVDDADFAGGPAVESLGSQAGDPEREFQRIAFWYAGLRERFFDDLIRESIKDGPRQLLLLGSGFDTRYLRLEGLSDPSIHTFEVDLPGTVSEKSGILTERMGAIPANLHLLPFDFNRQDLSELFSLGMNRQTPTVCVWQGVSYYLPPATVEATLRFLSESLPRGSALGFDCCSPLMLSENDLVPGARFNIRRLRRIAEPYLFAMAPDEMPAWLGELGFSDIQCADQQRLEQRYRPGIGLPSNMWYVVTAAMG